MVVSYFSWYENEPLVNGQLSPGHERYFPTLRSRPSSPDARLKPVCLQVKLDLAGVTFIACQMQPIIFVKGPRSPEIMSNHFFAATIRNRQLSV